MPEVSSGSVDQALLKVLEFQQRNKIAPSDLLLTMSLLSLMGILDYMQANRGAPVCAKDGASGNEQMINMLLSLMSRPGGGDMGKAAGQQPFNPALLLPLLTSVRGGGQLDPALLMGLLSGMMGSGPPPGEAKAPKGEVSRPAATSGPRQGEVLKWGGMPGQRQGTKESGGKE
ncbi:MAG: hypothetical protein AB1815_08350 [Bacillota bacterium]|jgi:hypothetical protein